jgi:tetraacyldisaccharide 4'-kinase
MSCAATARARSGSKGSASTSDAKEMLNALRLQVASGLEDGNRGFFVGDALSLLWSWAAARGIRRPLVLPPGARVIGVGGATLGGSGKTPFAIALARALGQAGSRTVLVGHAHRASPGRPRVVAPDDDIREVGDDALVASRALENSGVDVIVSPSRQAAVDFGARMADVLVVDGLLQARPDRLARSVLVLDGDEPWGSGRTPPLGDLKAPRHLFLAASDSVVLLSETSEPSCLGAFSDPPGIAKSSLLGARAPDGAFVALAELKGEAFGLLLGVARPGRVERSLSRHGLFARAMVRFADHLLPTHGELENATNAVRTGGLRAWLCTAKCRVRLPHTVGGVPVLALDHQVQVPAAELRRFAT